jgi:hypothetical protein
MELSAGSMIGIRNPHAYENAVLDSADAKNILYLAQSLDEGIQNWSIFP